MLLNASIDREVVIMTSHYCRQRKKEGKIFTKHFHIKFKVLSITSCEWVLYYLLLNQKPGKFLIIVETIES
jgi:hypothetical protein